MGDRRGQSRQGAGGGQGQRRGGTGGGGYQGGGTGGYQGGGGPRGGTGGYQGGGGGGYQGGGGPRGGTGGGYQGGGGGGPHGGGGGRGGRGGRDGGGRGGGRGGRMVQDEATYNPAQTQQHITPIIQSIQQLSLASKGTVNMPDAFDKASIEIAPRPKKAGVLGKSVKIATNFYVANFAKCGPLLHHDIRVERMRFNPETNQAEIERPAEGGRAVKPIPAGTIQDCVRKWAADNARMIGPWAYDGRNNLYATKTLTDPHKVGNDKYQEFYVQVPVPGRTNPSHFQLRLKMVARVTTDELKAFLAQQVTEWPAQQMQALEIVLNTQFINSNKLLYNGRTLYELNQRAQTVGSGGEAWIGYKQDLRPCQLGLMLSIEPKFSVFFEGSPVPDYAAAVLTKNPTRPWTWSNDYLLENERREVAKELKGLVVSGRYGSDNRETTFTATGLSRVGADKYMFPMRDRNTGTETQMSVANYFSRIRRVPLQFPQLQCVEGKGKGRSTIAVPMELLSIKRGQKRRGLLIGDQQAKLVRMAAQKPEVKRGDINTWVQKSQTMMAKTAQDFGVVVDKQPAVVNGRLLPAPVIAYGQPQNYYAGTTGAWNMKDFKMLQPVNIKCWAIVVCKDQRDLQGTGPGSLANWQNILVKSFTSMGITMAPKPGFVVNAGDLGRHPDQGQLHHNVNTLLNTLRNNPPNIVFFIMPKRDPSLYKVIKREMDSAQGIISQAIVAGKASGLGRAGDSTSASAMMQYAANVGLKVNHKLGGQNMRIRTLGGEDASGQGPPMWSSKPTMLIGVDVSHPASDDQSEPSIVGIVASLDRNFAQYACRIKRIGHREEVVSGMNEDIKALLIEFFKRNKKKPEAIVVYRDGVSQGEFKEVLFKEYTAIRQAGLELEDGYTPPITYCTVLKRHNMRMFPTSPDADDGGGNVRPGTCIDSGITLASGFDFYLNSHKGIQGTVKPAHYHVLHDENHFGSDAMQVASYWLCYTFCRCTRSVSYCPPAYYAHLVADRGRVLLDRDAMSEDYSSQAGGRGAPSAASSDPAAAKLHMPHEKILNKMFFV